MVTYPAVPGLEIHNPVKTPSGRRIDLSYGASRRITQATNVIGRKVAYKDTGACTANGNSRWASFAG